MMTAERYSQKLDLLRLHHQAWERKKIRKVRSLDPKEGYETIKTLLTILATRSLKEKGILFQREWQNDGLVIKVEELATWLDEVQALQIEPIQTKLRRPTREEPTIKLPFRSGRISCSYDSFLLFEEDLQTYETLLHSVPQALLNNTPFGKKPVRRPRRRRREKH